MKIAISYDGIGNIGTIKDYSDIDGKGQIGHFIVELELIKRDLLELWEEYCENEEGEK